MLPSREENQNLEKNQSPNEFAKNRAVIGNFFETYGLRQSINEFFQVQRKFHAQMNVLIEAFSSIQTKLYDPAQRRLLNELLQPYRGILNNPFKERQSGDIAQDIAHILSVVNCQNKQFKELLNSLLQCASNQTEFHDLLNDFRKNETYVSHLKTKMQSQSWLNVQGSIDTPFQNVLRYELLLKNITHELKKSNCSQFQEILDNVMDKIAELIPELKHINDNRDMITMLNRAGRVVGDLLENETRGYYSSKSEKTFPDNKEMLEEVMRYIINSKCQIAKAEDGN